MPYLLKVPFGREKKAAATLAKNGIEAKPAALRGYLISSERPARAPMKETGVSEATEVSVEEAERLLRGRSTPRSGLREGAAVRVTSGPYRGLSGIVRDVSEEAVVVDLALFGKVCPVRFRAEEVEAVIVCDWA